MASVEELPVGKVVGQYLFVSQDGADMGSRPDAVLVRGTVRFVCDAVPPLVYRARKVSAVALQHEAIFDSQGFLMPYAQGVDNPRQGLDRGLDLLANTPELGMDSPFTWTATFALTEVATGRAINVPPITFVISVGDELDLTEITSMNRSTGIITSRGLSAYEVALAEGFVGSQADWIESLHGTGSGGIGNLTIGTVVSGTPASATITGNTLNLVIPPGMKGDQGEASTTPGPSAYQVAVAAGFQGSTADWIASLRGVDGSDGRDGIDGRDSTVPGPPGERGPDGKTAFEVAVSQGYTGTVTQWLASLSGPAGSNGTDGVDGKSAYQLARDAGYGGTQTQWLASLKGADGAPGAPGAPSTVPGPQGKSAYQLAVENGFIGNQSQWLASLIGPRGNAGLDGERGAVGKSAYQLAQDAGYSGTLAQWLTSLQGQNGQDGQSAYQVAVSNGFTGTQAQWLASLKGATGEMGPIGPEGPRGLQGLPGAPGADSTVAGPRGPEGPMGPAGEAAMPVLSNMPAGYTHTVQKNASGTWPSRGTSRADIIVIWVGPEPSPPVVTSGTAGMLNGDIRLVTEV